MELILTPQSDTQVDMICDNQSSHTFGLQVLGNYAERILDDPIGYGRLLYQALFPLKTLTRRTLDATPTRIVIVALAASLDAIPWEYIYAPNGFLVQECPFVRALPAAQRIQPPTLNSRLHIVAVPSSPLSDRIRPLNIEAEWLRLKEIIQPLPFELTLERVRPPTIQQLRNSVANQSQRIIHFMGHGDQHETAAVLCFEKENGDLDYVTASQFATRVRGTVFLVTLNACVSAAPGKTQFNNLAASLVQQKIPYALGMRLNIHDDDARSFSRAFYDNLVRGTSVEEALLQARISLSEASIGIPVLYTSLAAPASGFRHVPGKPEIQEHQPPIEASALLRAAGTFQGRQDDLKQLGTCLTGDNRRRIITIHAAGGQGKTALARECVERFAHAWPGGVWGTTLEPLPDRLLFATNLAQFLGINTLDIGHGQEIERQILARLSLQRTLLVLDNAETLVAAVAKNDAAAIELGQFLQQLPGQNVSLLVTSRVPLGWPAEELHELGGLSQEDGCELFQQCAPQRMNASNKMRTSALSKKLAGHPLSLRLLGGAFNASSLSIDAFIAEYEQQLLLAQDRYRQLDHRHRSLYACIDISVRQLDTNQRTLLRSLSVFQGPFTADAAIAMFDTQVTGTPMETAFLHQQLEILWRFGLLTHKLIVSAKTLLVFYYLLPTIHLYIKEYMHSSSSQKKLEQHFGGICAAVVDSLYKQLDNSAISASVALQMESDIERGIDMLTDLERVYHQRQWAKILYRLGRPITARTILEQLLELAQEPQQPRVLYGLILGDLGTIHRSIGQPGKALHFFKLALPIIQASGNRADEAAILNNIALVYETVSQLPSALNYYEQALAIVKGLDDHDAVESKILANIAVILSKMGQPEGALEISDQVLPIIIKDNNLDGEAAALSNKAAIYLASGQYQEAIQLYEQSLRLTKVLGDRKGEATVLNGLGATYNAMGQHEQALIFYQQALSIRERISDLAGMAATLTNIGNIHQAAGQMQEALNTYGRACSICKEVGDRIGEATALNNMGAAYQAIGQREQALSAYEQALSICREIDHAIGEASTLASMARFYLDRAQFKPTIEGYDQAVKQSAGKREVDVQFQRALHLYEQALFITHKVSHRAQEAEILNNIGVIYMLSGQLQRALSYYEQALPIQRKMNNPANVSTTLIFMARAYQDLGENLQDPDIIERALPLLRELKDRAQEALALHNMGEIYRRQGLHQRALGLFERALPILHELKKRTVEAATLNNMGLAYKASGQPEKALSHYQQALSIHKETGHRAGEVNVLNNMAVLLYEKFNRIPEAVNTMQQAIDLLQASGISQGAGGETVARMQRDLETIRGTNSGLALTELQQNLMVGTLLIATKLPTRRADLRKMVEQEQKKTKHAGPDAQASVDFLTALLQIIDGKKPTLPPNHPYAPAIATLQRDIAANK